MSHIKRLSSPKTWNIPRKGTKYLTSPYPGKISNLSMPLNLIIRDLLKLASTRREVRIMLHNKEILVDGKLVDSTKFPVGLFDVVSIPRIKKNYRVVINEKRKIDLEEAGDSELKSKVYKVIGRTVLGGKKMQINLLNGGNFLSEAKVATNDSVVLDLAKKSMIKHLPLKAGAKALIVGGSHLGQRGTVEKLSNDEATLKIGKEMFQIKPKNIYVIG